MAGKLALSIAKATLTDILNDTSKKLFGLEVVKNPTASRGKKLDEILGEINKVQDSIKNLSNSVDDGFFGVKKDLVDQSVGKITSLYEQYMAALHSIGSVQKDKDGKDKDPKLNRRAIVNLGKQVASEVYSALNQIHTYLVQGDNSLLNLATASSIKKCKDVVIHYVGLKSFLLNYFAVQAKGVSLMTFADKDPDVPFAGASELVQNVLGHLEHQQVAFERAIGLHNHTLITGLLQAHDHKRFVTFAGAGGGYVNNFGTEMVDSAFESRFRLWTLECRQNMKSLDVETEYTFRLQFDPYWLAARWNSNGTSIPREGSQSCWRLIPASKQDKLQLQYKV